MRGMDSTGAGPVFSAPRGRAFARSTLGFHLLLQAFQIRDLGVPGYVKWHKALFHAWRRERKHRQAHRVLTEAELRASRKSDTVFVFGSGYSLNDISDDEWRHFERHDTLGLSGFIYQNWIRTDYHLIRGWVEVKAGAFNWRGQAATFADALHANPHFKDTILIMQGEYLAQFCNTLIGYGLIRPGTRIFRYHTARGAKAPSLCFKEGLTHAYGTLSDAVNFASCLGWKRIVLVGVDLYDSRYFWLKSHETLAVDDSGMLIPAEINTRGIRFDGKHNAVNHGILEAMRQWGELFAQRGVSLAVYNPRSLLSGVLPVYSRT